MKPQTRKINISSTGGEVPEDLDDSLQQIISGGPKKTPLTPVEGGEDKNKKFTHSKFDKEYRLKQVYSLLLRNMPVNDIAEELGVSAHTVIRDRKELYSRLREEARRIDVHGLIGETVAFFNETQAEAMIHALNTKNSVQQRLQALRSAVESRTNLVKFLQIAGVFEQLPYHPDKEKETSSIKELLNLTRSILGTDGGEELEEGLSEEDSEDIRLL